MASNTSDFFTFSKTAGTAKNLQKPTDGGDNNLWGGFINVDLDTIVGAVNATSDLIADANQNELVDFTATGSAVNHVGITNAATGGGPTIEAKGDDSNVDLNVKPKGTGAILLKDSDGNEVVKTNRTASAVNEITVANAATGNGPTISATGDDANIDLNIAGKGSGNAKFTSSIIIPDAGNIGSVSDPDAIAIASDGGLTFNGGIDNSGTISSGTFNGQVGDSATGKVVKAAEVYRLSANFTTASSTAVINQDWEIADDTAPEATFGQVISSVDLGSSATGAFTFSNTGFYLITVSWTALNPSSVVVRTGCHVAIQACTDGATFNDVAAQFFAIENTGRYVCGSLFSLIDVTSTTNNKVRVNTDGNGQTITYLGSTTKNQCAISFLRLGDT